VFSIVLLESLGNCSIFMFKRNYKTIIYIYKKNTKLFISFSIINIFESVGTLSMNRGKKSPVEYKNMYIKVIFYHKKMLITYYKNVIF